MRTPGLFVVGLFLSGCASQDNPTALADLNPVAEFEVELAEVETMQAVEVLVSVREGGSPMRLRNARLEVQSPSGPTQLIPLESDPHGYGAHVRFYEPGEHHLHLHGQPEKNHLSREMGEHDLHVERQHLEVSDHRFEIAVSPAPIIVGAPGRVILYAWELEHDGGIGHEAEGVELHATLHMPNDAEVRLEFAEVEHGQYEAAAVFPVAGSYGLQVEVEADDHGDEDDGHDDEGDDHGDEGDDDHADGEDDDHGAEFEIHVPSLTGEIVDDGGDDDGHGH